MEDDLYSLEDDDSFGWMSMVPRYFPFLYGMLMIEMKFIKEHDEVWIEDKKIDFLQKAIKYFRDNNLFIIEEDVEKLYSIKVKKEYCRLLLEKYYDYEGNEHLKNLIKIALGVINDASLNITDLTEYEVINSQSDEEGREEL